MEGTQRRGRAHSQLRAAPGDGLLGILLLVLIVGVPTVFLRSVIFSFFIPKLSLLWITAFAVALIGIYRLFLSGAIERGPRSLTVASLVFGAALVLTSVVSSQPWDAATGLNARGAGAISYVLCLVLLHATFGFGRRRPVSSVIFAFGVGNAIVAFYALLQAYHWDPVAWGQTNVGHAVFSTLGNSNFSASYLAITLPLVTWITFGSPLSTAVRIGGGTVIGASCLALIYLNSTQGDGLALFAVLVLGQWAVSHSKKDRLVASLIVSPVGAVLLMPLALGAAGVTLPAGLIVVTATCSYLGVRWDQKRSAAPRSEADQVTSSVLPWVVVGTATLAIAGALLARRIAEGIEEGLEGRIDFWKAALSIFRTNPLLGTGPETFFAHFAAHRPVEHAVEWELVTSDSAHSVPLGILSGGGLVLATAYLFIIAVIGYFGVQAIRGAEPRQRLLYVAVFASWVTYHLQSLVSMDGPGLVYIQWILGGVLLAGGAPDSLPARSLTKVGLADRRTRRISSSQKRGWIVALVAIFLVSLVPLSAPLRANTAALRAQVAVINSDFETAGTEMNRAADLQPKVGLYAEIRAYLYEQNGQLESAFEELERSAHLQPGYSVAAIRAARMAHRLDHRDSAGYWYERAVSADPLGASVLTEAAWYFVEIGQPERAEDLMKSFESLHSRNTSAWQIAHHVYAAIGDGPHADRALDCATRGKEYCWPNS